MKTSSLLLLLVIIFAGCQKKDSTEATAPSSKINVIFDTDANNEVDDQHALAYLLFNGSTFNLLGVTVNATKSGGAIANHVTEAGRILELCTVKKPLLKGADLTTFDVISPTIDSAGYDGEEAVNFIIDASKPYTQNKLVVIAVGKLTNLALALKKDPSLAQRIRLVWLGSNYPNPGEYNLENDTTSLQYVLSTAVPLELVTVSYGFETGTDAVKISQEEVKTKLAKKGPVVTTPVMGRHGVAFTTFGDYAVNLFDHIDLHGNPPSRALYDMAAVAIVKNPAWATKREVPRPTFVKNGWRDQPGAQGTVSVWENFDKENIMKDFFNSIDHYDIVE